ncbi:MAG: hypothetical protein K6T83_03670 [Alicyclobacillus sp.]|nr:hypothetical protein [Alicyclobacillus sp.]
MNVKERIDQANEEMARINQRRNELQNQAAQIQNELAFLTGRFNQLIIERDTLNSVYEAARNGELVIEDTNNDQPDQPATDDAVHQQGPVESHPEAEKHDSESD